MSDAPRKRSFYFAAFPALERSAKPRPITPPTPADPPTEAALDLPFPEPDEVTRLPSPPAELAPDPTAPPEKHFNYFNYFSEIEAAFAAHRGKPYRLSPLDWALIEGWRKDGVPLPVVLRAIAQTFAARAKAAGRQPKGRPRPVRSLGYCQPAVEEAFRAYQAGRVGKAVPAAPAAATDGASCTAVVGFLEAAAQALLTAHRNLATHLRPDAPHARLGELLPAAAAQLQTLLRQVQSEAPPSLEDLETSLSELEDALLAALEADAPVEVQTAVAEEAAATLRPYRKGMSAAAYRQAQANYVARLLRRRYGVPRLSLFHLESAEGG
ncbi:MAG: hypothetical protein NZ585_05800 [Chloracidobacterium sp.]|nr:hypothetical protein [Chloracidobacterium sp.]MDW8217569.1 hypothetical protein [Acidobacteriota bacterium]